LEIRIHLKSSVSDETSGADRKGYIQRRSIYEGEIEEGKIRGVFLTNNLGWGYLLVGKKGVKYAE
jgi:hypothetical protein